MAESRPTVLLVDDEEENLLVLSALLDRDYGVLTARSGEKALSLLAAHEVDVLITDQRMPGMSGIELVKRTRLLHPDVVRIVLTAYTDTDVMLDAINEGSVYGFVIKPWSVDQMRVSIRQAVEWADMRRRQGELAAELQHANRELARRNEELRRAREQLLVEEKLAAVGLFAAEMMHEMGNHLTIVDAIADEMGSLGQPPWDESVRILQAQTEQLVTIVKDIRLFATGARLRPEMRPVRPDELVLQVAEMCRRIPSLKHVRVVVDAPEVGSWMLDRAKMMHLLANLLRNAMQASPEDEPVTVTLRARDDFLLIAVEDRGPGVPPEARDQIFEPFLTTKGEGGTGLGLTICRWVAELHGGAIRVGSGDAGGALFEVTLPRLGEERAPG